jgi:RNA polymerase sigma-70 factor (family 1)
MQNNKNKSIEIIPSSNEETPVIGITKEQTFDYFFREYYAVLCFFAQSIIHNEEEAKDIVQDCFVKLWDNDTITERASSVKSFLYTMVRNECINYLRRKKVKTKAVIYLQTPEADEKYFDEIAFAETVRLVLKRMEELPPRMSTIIKKYYLQGKRHKKIAAELSSSENAIQMYKRRAMKLLKQKLLFFKR